MSVRRPYAGLALAVATWSWACGDGADGRGAAGGVTSKIDSVAAGSSTSGTVLREYPLRLVNPRPYVIVVLASADAAEVVVDTVPAADSLSVQLALETDLVRLRALDLEGNELGSGYLSFEDAAETASDSIPRRRWELPPPP